MRMNSIVGGADATVEIGAAPPSTHATGACADWGARLRGHYQHLSWKTIALAGLVGISSLIATTSTTTLLTTQQWLLTVQFQPEINVPRGLGNPAAMFSSVGGHVSSVATAANTVASQAVSEAGQAIHNIEQAASIAVAFGTRHCCATVAGSKSCVTSPFMATLVAGLLLETLAAASTTIFLVRRIAQTSDGDTQPGRNRSVRRVLKGITTFACVASSGLYLSFLDAVLGVQQIVQKDGTGVITSQMSFPFMTSLLPVVMPAVTYLALEMITRDVNDQKAETYREPKVQQRDQ